MQYRLAKLFALIFVAGVLGGCSTTSSPAVPTVAPTAAAAAPAATSGPAETAATDFEHASGRSLTVFQAVPIAERRAKDWNKDAVLYQLMPSALTFRNIGRPMVQKGWFFQFGTPGSKIELLVQVTDATIGGTTEAEPLLTEPLPYELVPLDISQLKLDSPQVFAQWQQGGGTQYLEEHADAEIELRLSHIKGTANPIWSVVDDKNPGADLLSVDAVTGERVARPVNH